MPYLHSCNIACGGHAGDKNLMRRSINLAVKHGVAIGAHPSYPDRDNFGRKKMDISIDLLMQSVKQQLKTFLMILEEEDQRLHHIKPHGAFYHKLAEDKSAAEGFTKLLQQLTPEILVYGAPDSVLQSFCLDRGLIFWSEGFVDRRYDDTGNLLSRKRENALITNPKTCADQALQIASKKQVTTVSGYTKALEVQTLCVHGDNPNALEIAKAIHKIASA